MSKFNNKTFVLIFSTFFILVGCGDKNDSVSTVPGNATNPPSKTETESTKIDSQKDSSDEGNKTKSDNSDKKGDSNGDTAAKSNLEKTNVKPATNKPGDKSSSQLKKGEETRLSAQAKPSAKGAHGGKNTEAPVVKPIVLTREPINEKNSKMAIEKLEKINERKREIIREKKDLESEKEILANSPTNDKSFWKRGLEHPLGIEKHFSVMETAENLGKWYAELGNEYEKEKLEKINERKREIIREKKDLESEKEILANSPTNDKSFWERGLEHPFGIEKHFSVMETAENLGKMIAEQNNENEKEKLKYSYSVHSTRYKVLEKFKGTDIFVPLKSINDVLYNNTYIGLFKTVNDNVYQDIQISFVRKLDNVSKMRLFFPERKSSYVEYNDSEGGLEMNIQAVCLVPLFTYFYIKQDYKGSIILDSEFRERFETDSFAVNERKQFQEGGLVYIDLSSTESQSGEQYLKGSIRHVNSDYGYDFIVLLDMNE